MKFVVASWLNIILEIFYEISSKTEFFFLKTFVIKSQCKRIVHV